MTKERKEPFGRPSIYTPELADKICELVATSEHGLDIICDQNPELPNESTIRAWRFTKPDFSTKYTQAKQQQAELYAESTLKIAIEKATYRDAEGNDRVDVGHVAWQKLNINTRQWHASKLAPKIYGDQKRVEELENENARYKEEIAAIRDKLDKTNVSDY